MNSKNNKFYLDISWYLKLILSITFFVSLVLGFYYCCFKDDWYISDIHYTIFVNASKIIIIDYPYVAFWNAEALLSFYSVQVAIITFLFITVATIFHKYDGKIYLFSARIKNILVVWNLIMIIIFWYGVFTLSTTKGGISAYCKSQLILSLITHLICPIIFIFYIYFFGCESKIKNSKQRATDILLTLSYPIIYFIYIIIRAKLIAKDDTLPVAYKGWIPYYWYDFMNFDTPMIGSSRPGFACLFLLFFIIFYILTWFLLSYITSSIYKYKIKKGFIDYQENSEGYPYTDAQVKIRNLEAKVAELEDKLNK